jgi:uncharacterized membrane protein
MTYNIPVLHPLVNHFPIALLIVAAGAAVAWLIWGNSFWRYSTLLLLATGLVGAIVAKITGETMEDFSKGREIVKQLVELHSDLAVYTLIGAAVTLVVVGIYSYRAFRMQRAAKDPFTVRLISAVLAIITAILVGWTGHVGGTMTWGEPATGSQQQINNEHEHN